MSKIYKYGKNKEIQITEERDKITIFNRVTNKTQVFYGKAKSIGLEMAKKEARRINTINKKLNVILNNF